MKKSKTFKIGEYALGGIIKVIKNRHTVTIQAIDYSNPKKIIDSATLFISDSGDIDIYLNYLTTCYHADKIMQFIKH